MKRKLVDFYDFFRYDIPNGIENVIRWVPLIWKDRDWDEYFLLRVMQFKLRKMGECFRDYGHLVHSDRYSRQCLVASELCRRLREDEYGDPKLHYTKKTKYDYQREECTKKNDQRYLGLLIGKYLRHWWD